jgi:phospholipid/cholesterol/gamma-HCH transport system substrate-binding protein
MDEQGYRFGVGVLVVASLVIVIILILFFGAAPNFFAKRYQVTIKFPAAPGVETDTPVRKNGVQIGRVTDVKLLDVNEQSRDEEGGVILRLELDSKVRVRASEVARIGTGSLITGDAVIEFVPGNQASRLARFDGVGGSPKDGVIDQNEQQIADAYLADGDYSGGPGAGQVAPDPLNALVSMQESVVTTLASMEQASNQVNLLAGDIRRVIGGGEGDTPGINRKLEQTIDNFNQTLNAIEGLFNDPALRSAIATTSNRLPQLINEAETVMQQTKSTLASFEGVGVAAEETMKNVAEFTRPLGKQGDKLVSDAVRALGNLDALLAEVRQVTAKVNSSQGTVAKLLEDDELYFSLVRTLENVETLTRRMQPIVEDVRIFSDKVARDPSQVIGLRGALSGRPAGIGVK